VNRRNVVLAASIAALALMVGGGLDAKVYAAGSSAQRRQAGCATCHGTKAAKTLSLETPAGHAKATASQPAYCLGCHTTGGTAPALAWKIHQSHFARTPAPTCLSCHQVDAKGDFRVIGTTKGPQIKTTVDVLTALQPKYESWATSTHIDHSHAVRGATCISCHGTAFPTEAPKKEQCFTCHGNYEELSKKSMFHQGPRFPHFGEGDSIECSECHKGHQQSVLACAGCHAEMTDPVP
jgi:hypothetical protein